MKKSAFFAEMAKPFLVLVIICLISAALLSATNLLTAPIISTNAAKTAEEARAAVLPEATGFTELDASQWEDLGVTSIYADVGGSGYVITVTTRGYKGDISVTVGFAPDGTVLHLLADVSSETTGIGTKAGDEAYLAGYVSLQGSAEDVDTITGATFSTVAVRRAVSAAMTAFAGMGGN